MSTKKDEGKIVSFRQISRKKSSKKKAFRNDCVVSNDLMQEMLDVFALFINYAVARCYSEYAPDLHEIVEEHGVLENKKEGLHRNLFWWLVFYASSHDPHYHYIEEFIEDYNPRFKWKPIIISWLKECKKSIPKFYYVGYKHNNRVLVLIDFLTNETIDVIVYDPKAVPPKQGEIVMGTLLPIGDGLYFPIIDFYHFEYEARMEVGQHIRYYYEKYLKNTTMYAAFIHVLSNLLQIETIIINENKKNSTSP